MKLKTRLCLFMSVAAPTLAVLRCFECNQNCTEGSVKESGRRIEFRDEGSTHINKAHINRLVAPWKYIQNINATRFPEIIWTASCNHEKCLNNSLSGPNHFLRVMPITYKIRVYHRQSCRNKMHFRLVPGTFLVTVGCTCFRRKTHSLGLR